MTTKTLIHRASAVAVSLLSAAAVAQTRTLSDPATWNLDFLRGASPSATCAVDTIQNLRGRMYVRGPFSVEGYEQTISHRYTTAAEPDRVVTVFNRASDFVKAEMAAGDSIYAFEFLSGSQENFWGFSGYAVARGDCVIHVDVTEYLN